MFGVGFFSVFALTETPAVNSGGTQLRFEWDDGELVADESELPPMHREPGAAFVLPLKDDADALHWALPSERDALARMLGTMLLFTQSLTSIALSVTSADGVLLKQIELSKSLDVLRSVAHTAQYNAGGPLLPAICTHEGRCI